MVEPLVHCTFDKMLPLDELKPNPENPNVHPASQIKRLAHIIRAQGWRSPITVSNLSGLIVRGHGRLQAAIEAECTVAPVDLQNYATREQEFADLVADNRLSELSRIDTSLFPKLFGEMDMASIDRSLTGWDAADFDELLGLNDDGFADFDAQVDNQAGKAETNILISVPKEHEEAVSAWLSNGEGGTGYHRGIGVLKRCGLL